MAGRWVCGLVTVVLGFIKPGRDSVEPAAFRARLSHSKTARCVEASAGETRNDAPATRSCLRCFCSSCWKCNLGSWKERRFWGKSKSSSGCSCRQRRQPQSCHSAAFSCCSFDCTRSTSSPSLSFLQSQHAQGSCSIRAPRGWKLMYCARCRHRMRRQTRLSNPADKDGRTQRESRAGSCCRCLRQHYPLRELIALPGGMACPVVVMILPAHVLSIVGALPDCAPERPWFQILAVVHRTTVH